MTIATDWRMPPEPSAAEGEGTACPSTDETHVDDFHRDCAECDGPVCTDVDDPAVGCDLGGPMHRECHAAVCRDDRCWTDC